MEEKLSDLMLELVWSRTKEHLKVRDHQGTLLFNSVTGIVSPLLSDRQVKWILEDYERKRMNYAFA